MERYPDTDVPDPHPDPYVFRPPGSGSVGHKYGSGKNSKKTLDFYCFVTLFVTTVKQQQSFSKHELCRLYV
jgi:hypothetical protein